MSLMLHEIPSSERPRERLIKYGPESLATYELLAILLRTGTRDISVIDLAKNVLKQVENINMLNQITINELKKIKGIGEVKAIELLASIELGKRINTPLPPEQIVDTPKKAYLLVKEELQHLTQETLVCLYLNAKSELIAKKTISVGTLSQTIINPRDIFKWAFKLSSMAIVLIHNHPSGNPEPSQPDILMTQKIVQAAKIVDLLIVDHIIVGKNRYFSFQEHNMLF